MTTIDAKMHVLGIEPIYDDFRPLRREKLIELERTLGARIPASYKAFLQQFGCSYTPGRVVCVRSIAQPPSEVTSGNTLELGVFLGAGEKTHDLLRTMALNGDRLPPRGLPFANDPSGNLFLLRCENPEEVYFWSHMHDEEGETFDRHGSSLTLVATSFEDFVARLEVCG